MRAANSAAEISPSAARARAKRATKYGPRNFQYARGLRMGEPFQRDKQQSLPLFKRKSKERIGKFAAWRGGGGRHFPGGARPARVEIFLLHVSFGAQPSGCQPLAVPFGQQRIEVEMKLGSGQAEGCLPASQCPQQNRLDEIVGDFIWRRMAGNERASKTAEPWRT